MGKRFSVISPCCRGFQMSLHHREISLVRDRLRQSAAFGQNWRHLPNCVQSFIFTRFLNASFCLISSLEVWRHMFFCYLAFSQFLLLILNFLCCRKHNCVGFVYLCIFMKTCFFHCLVSLSMCLSLLELGSLAMCSCFLCSSTNLFFFYGSLLCLVLRR